MKRLCFILATLALLTSCDTIKIAINNTNSEGERRIMTTDTRLFTTKGYEVNLAMGLLIQGRDTLEGLVITCDSPVKEALFNVGSKMLIRLSDDQTIVLKNMLNREHESHTETEVTERMQTDYGYIYSPWSPFLDDATYRVTSMVPEVYYKQVNNSYAIYPITYDQMQAIISKGVTKLRIETNVINLDMPHTKGVADKVNNLATCLIEGIQDNPQDF